VSGGVSVSGGLLQGIGTITGNVSLTAGGSITGGTLTAPGTLDITGNLDLSGGGTFDEVIGSASSYSSLDVSGDVTLGGTSQLDITLLNGFNPTGDSFTIIDPPGPELTGIFGNLPVGGNFAMDGENWTISYGADDVVLTGDSEVTSTATPEPGALIMLSAGLLALAFFGRKRFSSTSDK